MKKRIVIACMGTISMVLLLALEAFGGVGFITVSADKRHFQFEDGSPFIPVGHNEACDRSLLLDPGRLDRYFAYMAQHGENLFRILLDDGSVDSRVELRVGQFNPDLVAAMDNLIAAAQKHGIYLIMSLWYNLDEKNPFTKRSWAVHPYNRNYDRQKGLVDHSVELLTNEKAIAAAENRMQFFIERWGKSKNLFAWELCNEFNAMGTIEEQNYWIEEIGSFAKDLEIDLYGGHHLRTVSTSDAAWGTSASGIYTSPELDFTSYHTYGQGSYGTVSVNYFTGIPWLSTIDPIEYIQFIYRSAQVVREKSTARPALGTEDFGIYDPKLVPWPLNISLKGYTSEQRDDFFIGSAWASLMGGGAGPSLRWPCVPGYSENGPGGYRALSTGMYDDQAALTDVLFTTDLTGLSPVAASDVLSTDSPKGIIPMVLSDGRTELVWLLNSQPAFTRSAIRCSVTFRSLQSVRYCVTWYDLRTGEILQENYVRGPGFTLQSPMFRTFVTAVVTSATP